MIHSREPFRGALGSICPDNGSRISGATFRRRVLALPQDALWYKDALIYQVHVRTFYDSTGDGVGDFRGLAQKLDYLQELGITAIWLMPFFPSPLRDDGYDIADYRSVHPSYGTLDDFKAFLEAAHQRGIRVIIEMVLNNTPGSRSLVVRASTHAATGMCGARPTLVIVGHALFL